MLCKSNPNAIRCAHALSSLTQSRFLLNSLDPDRGPRCRHALAPSKPPACTSPKSSSKGLSLCTVTARARSSSSSSPS